MGVLTLENFIDGKYVPFPHYVDSFNPSTGEVYAKVPDSDAAVVELAVQAAQTAMTKWGKTSPQARSNIMLKIASLLEERIDEFAKAESEEQGKPLWLAKSVDIPRAVHNFRFFATAILHQISESTLLPEANAINYVVNQPAGVAGLITPWNLPLYLLTFKLAPAIAAGCCVVAKPSEITSVTAWKLCSLLNEAGLPQGVINMVFGTGRAAGSAIVEHPGIKLLSFTGSTTVGKFIQQSSAAHVKKLSLELGGKNAGIIFSDANFEKCVTTSVRSAFANQGEICLCTSRLFVHVDIFDKFCKRYVELVREMKVGPPGNEDTKIGALVSKEHLEKVKSYVKFAVEDGGTILCGETVNDPLDLPNENKAGYFMHPTVVVGLDDSARCMQEEIFGPVVCISPFKTEEEVIKRANNVAYGLAATLWTQDVSRLHRVGQQLEAGTVWCNCWMIRDLRVPFGGMKMSGVGRESQHESLAFYSEQKTICVQL